MTDVTGFGLAGHLMEMMRASGTAAQIDLAAIPLLDGAEALAAAGHASTIAPLNRAAIDWELSAPETARTALLFDPQTAGPLLAAVSQDKAADLLASLHRAGETAAIIGTVTEGPPHLTAI
jgi:selenide,water dikinase